MLSFKPTFSLSSFTFIKRLFSSSSLSAIRVVSSAYLRSPANKKCNYPAGQGGPAAFPPLLSSPVTISSSAKLPAKCDHKHDPRQHNMEQRNLLAEPLHWRRLQMSVAQTMVRTAVKVGRLEKVGEPVGLSDGGDPSGCVSRG